MKNQMIINEYKWILSIDFIMSIYLEKFMLLLFTKSSAEKLNKLFCVECNVRRRRKKYVKKTPAISLSRIYGQFLFAKTQNNLKLYVENEKGNVLFELLSIHTRMSRFFKSKD